MAVVVRLVTVVDIDERNFPIPLAGDPVVVDQVPEGVEPGDSTAGRATGP